MMSEASPPGEPEQGMRSVCWGVFVVLASALPLAAQAVWWPQRTLRVDWPAVSQVSEPGRFAVALPQRIDTSDGIWTEEGADAVWRLDLVVPGARSLALSTDGLSLPPGAVMRVGAQQVSVATARWWSRHEPGERLHLEVRLPRALRTSLVLGIDEIQAGSRDPDTVVLTAKADDGCTVNFSCAASEAQQQWAQGVVALQVMNQVACTGTLVNNSAGDGRALLLTAAHCHRVNGVVVDAAQAATSMRVFWNASSACGGTLARADTGARTEGAVHRAEYADSWLVELANPPPAAANAWWAGFDAGDAPMTGGVVGIHHAGGLARQLLSTAEAPRATVLDGVFGSVYGLLAWRVSPPVGSAAAGASGSALLDASGRVLGTLSTGSACSAMARSTLNYARLSQAWDGDGSRAGSLKPWLDPAGTGRQLSGKRYAPGSTPVAEAAATSSAAASNPGAGGGGGAFALPWWLLLAAWRRRRSI